MGKKFRKGMPLATIYDLLFFYDTNERASEAYLPCLGEKAIHSAMPDARASQPVTGKSLEFVDFVVVVQPIRGQRRNEIS